MKNVTVYSTVWCGDCRRAKRLLDEAGILYQEIDIDRDPASAQRIIEWSGGRRVIPTIRIACDAGTQALILQNPGAGELRKALRI